MKSTSSTTTCATTTSNGTGKFEEEVDLLAGSSPAPRHHPGSHIYRIRAPKMNGQFQMPPIKVSSVTTSRPDPSTTFGSRQPARHSVGTSTGKPRAVGEDTATSSVAASSPTLRLTTTGLNRTLGRLVAPDSEHLDHKPEVEADRTLVAAGGSLVSSMVSPLEWGASSSEREELPVSTNTQNRPALGWAPSLEATSADSILSLIEEFDSKIITNRTTAQLSCDSGEMILRLNFTEPFKGIVYPNHNRVSACRFFGDGHHNYELRLPLRGCGTRQAAPRVFVNDVIVRFHKTLELEEDEVKTLICRYPPPLAPTSTSTAELANSVRPGKGYAPEVGSSSPFELIDEHSDQRTVNGENQLDTQSENLVVAPSRDQSAQVSAAGDFRLSRPTPTRGDLILTSGGVVTASQQSGFFERLSSVELLFMISSLMFLVLLALGLAASYLCFRRASRRRGVEQRANAILRRKRHLAGPPPGAILPGPYGPGGRSIRASSGRQPSGLANPANGGYLLASGPPDSSSPESELSQCGLLAPPAPPRAYFYTNRAFAPELSNVDHKKPYIAPSVGRRDALGQRHLLSEPGQAPPPPPPPVQQRHLSGRAHYAGANGAKYAIFRPAHYGYPVDQRFMSLDGTQSLWRAKSMMGHQPVGRRLEGGPTLSRRERSRDQSRHHTSNGWSNEQAYSTSRPPHQQHQQMPRLYLKSIEDSYITKFTEIHEQEYRKRDNTQPLSTAEWRRLAERTRANSTTSSSSTGTGNAQAQEPVGTEPNNNLRSLTELDVHFARSLLRPARPPDETPATELRPARSMERLPQAQEGPKTDSAPPERAQSEPEVAALGRSSSPDLILSPEYEHARLELTGSSGSHNTSSYV